jgi:putative transposase
LNNLVAPLPAPLENLDITALHIDEAAIFRTIEKMRLIVDEATSATKIARRHRERRLRVIPGGKSDAAQSHPASPPELRVDEDDDYSRLQILPFEEWS